MLAALEGGRDSQQICAETVNWIMLAGEGSWGSITYPVKERAAMRPV